MVSDFGIAVLGEVASTENSNEVVGTAEFMSPEQAKGTEVDARSDIYSLGCVGFLALSGRVPFTGPTAAAILGQHITEPPAPLASVAPQVPPAVAAALDRCLRKDPDHRFSGGESLADALTPDAGTDRELPVPLRVFLKESRGVETTLSWTLLVQVAPFSGLMNALLLGEPWGVVAGWALGVAVVAGIPVEKLAREARRLLKSGFTLEDGIDAFVQDVGRRNEEFRFQVGQRVTWLDRTLNGLRLGGLLGTGATLLAGLLGGWQISSVAFELFPWAFTAGMWGFLFHELRVRRRGDVMGERLLRFLKGKSGKGIFKLGGFKLKRVASSVSGIHRSTEVAIGLAADRLFEELPRDVRKSLKGLPGTVRGLEDDAQAMRRQVAELDAVLAEIGDDDPSRPGVEERARVRAGVMATRDEAGDKLREAVTALETIRLGLLFMHSGTGTVESLTMDLEAARNISDHMENLLEGHREVERILLERRKTGVFTIVTEGD